MEFKLALIPMVWVYYGIVLMMLLGSGLFLRAINKKKNLLTWVVIIVLAIVVTYLVPVCAYQTKAVVREDSFELILPPYARETIYFKDIKNSFMIDLSTNKAFWPTYRNKGSSIGLYGTGWYHLYNNDKALIMMNQKKVLILDLGSKKVLLSPERLDEFNSIIIYHMMTDTPVTNTTNS